MKIKVPHSVGPIFITAPGLWPHWTGSENKPHRTSDQIMDLTADQTLNCTANRNGPNRNADCGSDQTANQIGLDCGTDC